MCSPGLWCTLHEQARARSPVPLACPAACMQPAQPPHQALDVAAQRLISEDAVDVGELLRLEDRVDAVLAARDAGSWNWGHPEGLRGHLLAIPYGAVDLAKG